MTDRPGTLVTQPVQVPAVPPLTIGEGAPAVLRDLSAALAELVGHLPGPVQRAVDVQNRLRIDRKLAWQIFRLARSGHPLSEAANVPARRSMDRLLAAARRRVPLPVVDRVGGAFDRFEAFLASHREDRAGFLSIVSGLGLDADQRAELKVRKSLFRANAHVWGVRSAAVVRTVVVHPGAASEGTGGSVLIDGVMIGGNVAMQRVRPGAPLSLGNFLKIADEPLGAIPPGKDEDPGVAPPRERQIHPVKVLTQFSTQPLPLMVPREDPVGDTETELVFPASGRAGAITIYTMQHASAGSKGAQAQYGLNILVGMVSEALTLELVVPQGMTDPATMRVAVYGRRVGVEKVLSCRASDLLPQREHVAHFSGCLLPPPIPDSPRHCEAVQHVLGQLGWLGTKFDVYRCRVQYPVLHTLIRVAADTFRRSGS